MIRHLCAAILLLLSVGAKSQCPRIYNYLGALTYTPQFINCNGSAYTIGFQSDVSFGSYTVSWGDGSPDHSAASYTANSIINHTYSAVTNSYILTFTTGTCVLTGTVVNEQPSLASIVVPGGVGSNLCAPKTLTFSNATTFTSTSTTYTWYFGDGSPPEVHTYTNSGQNVTHVYQKGTVNCVTQVTLLARNYCNFTPSSNSFGPLQVYDIDNANITPDRFIKCWPDNQFTFTNSTNRNCVPQGNTSQRYELWNFGDHWSTGGDSIINWSPWPPSSPRTISFPGIGPYSVSLLDSNVCGVDTQIIFVNIVNAPVAALQVPTVTICEDSPVTFTNSSSTGYQYRWNFGTGGGFVTLGGTTRTFTYNTPGTYTVRLVALLPGGGNACSDTVSGVVNVMPAPVPGFSLTPSAGCGSLSVAFTDLSTGATTWNWLFGNGSTSTLQTPAPQDYTLAGTHTPTLNVSSAAGCVRSTTASLLVRNKPLPSFVSSNACEGSPVTFSNTSVAGGADPVTGYTWMPGDGSAALTATNASHTFTAAGTYTVLLKAETAFCTDSVSSPVTIFVKPTASFAITPTVACPPFTAQFSNLTQNATNFLWHFGTAPGATAVTTGAQYTYSNATQTTLTHTVTMVATSTAGCSDTASYQVQVRPKPVAGFTSNVITGCSPLPTSFTSTSLGVATYSWSFGDGNSSAAANPVHSYTNSGIFTQTVIATLYVTNSVSCSDTTSQLITIYPEALPAFSMVPQAGCSPLQVNFPSVPGVATYSWNHGDGSNTFTTLGSHTHTFVNSGLTDVTFTVSLSATTSNGCSGSGTGTLAVYHKPVADFSITAPEGCTPFSTIFTDLSTGSVSSTIWTFGNGDSSNNSIVSVTYTNQAGDGAKQFSNKLVVTTGKGCKDSVSKQVSVFPQPRAAFTPDTPACSPGFVSFDNRSAGADQYLWKFGDGAESTDDSTSHLFINNTGLPKSFNVLLVAVNQSGCRDSVTVPVTVYPKPEFLITANPPQGCSPLTTTFPSIVGVKKYEWMYNDNIVFGSSGDVKNTFENNGNTTRTFTVQLIAHDSHNCSDTATTLINVFPQPIARFSARPLSVFVPDQPVAFINESSSLASAFEWEFGDGGKSTEEHPQHLYTSPGEYNVTLTVTSIHGCMDTFTLDQPVIALEETNIQMPNAFTPNTSGSRGTIYDPYDTSNDIFHPNVKGADKFTFSIYSRWGELLFETRNPAEGWDGYYKGKLCTPDVYIWKVSATFIDGKTYNKTGDVLLLR